MLDEPTNHLDLNAVIWLESYLGQQYSETARRPKTLIVVSHDAGFLDEVCTHIVHIENFKIRYYRGGYSQFETQLEQAHAEADKKNEQIMKKISEQKRQGKSKLQVAEWLKEQCRLGKVDEEFVQRRTEYSVTFPFSQPPELRDACIIKLEDVAFNYPNGPELFRGVSCALWSDSRITLCGPNGIGKSTLLNLMTGDLEPTEGHVQLNRQVRIGRYTQHFIDKLPLERTPVEFLVSLGMKPEDGRAQLGCFGLEGVCHGQICASLSGGQKARVALAALTLPKPHFLLFDEPTNHLDLESIEALCDAINGFAGGVLVVTHDARLIERTNMQLWIAGNKTVVPFRGDLNDYKAMIRRDFLREEAAREEERLEKQRSKMEAKQHGGVEAAAAAKEAAAAVEKVKLAEEADALFAELDKKKKKKKKE
jgi:ATP-binding cassette subfamily F protein 1